MQNLLSTLDKMQDVLHSLVQIMHEEQQQLAAGKLDSHHLQRITEDKSALLTTLRYLDEMRSSGEQQMRLAAPYPRDRQLGERWQAIQTLTGRLSDSNRHNGLLLRQHQQLNDAALQVLKPHHSQAFYGPDGLGKGQATLSRKA